MKQTRLIPPALLFTLVSVFTMHAASQTVTTVAAARPAPSQPAPEPSRTVQPILHPAVQLVTQPIAQPIAEPTTARVVHYSADDIVPIQAKLRYTTLIVLPADEKILDFTTGDKEFWIINGVQNFCFLHPAKAGTASNLNLITDKGHVYSFTLQEISDEPNAEPDLKVLIEPKDQSTLTALDGNTSLAPASEVEAYRAEAVAARTQAQKDEAQFRSQYPLQIKFDYDFPKNKDPFDVDAIYEDGHFTYIRCAATEKPALYEEKDGDPSLVDFQLSDGVYIVSHVLDKGYLQIGKKKMQFHRTTDQPAAPAPSPSPEQ